MSFLNKPITWVKSLFKKVQTTVKKVISPRAIPPGAIEPFYFRFEIPTMKDGTTVTYSPGWCGRRDRCAEKETGLYYNDKERWGIGIGEGRFIPPDVKVIFKEEAEKIISEAKDEEGVFFGQKLEDRHVPEAVEIEEPEVIEPEEVYIPPPPREIATVMHKFCPLCT